MIVVVEFSLKEVTFYTGADATRTPVRSSLVEDPDHVADVASMRGALRRLVGRKKIEAVGVRVPFGGDGCRGPVRVTPAALARLGRAASPFPFYAGMGGRILTLLAEACRPAPVYAFFETAFFNDLPPEERQYAIPSEYSERNGVAKTGYHGIFHACSASVDARAAKVVSVVLDKQTTVAAVCDGKPVTVSIGYTPLEGIMGRTSVGDLDPGIAFFLMKHEKASPVRIDDMLKRQSGFFGMTGYDAEIAALYRLYGKDRKIELAFDVYRYQILKYVADGAAAMHGIDALVFAGMHVTPLLPLIHKLLKDLSFLGISLKPFPWKDGAKGAVAVTAAGSAVAAYLNLCPLAAIICRQTRLLATRR